MDLTKLSDEELQQLYEKSQGATTTPAPPTAAPAQPGTKIDLTKLSDAELRALSAQQPPPREAMRPRGAEIIEQTPGMRLPTAPGGAGNTLQTADDIMRNVASGATFGGAEKLAAFIDSQFGNGSYDELLAKHRKETEEAGGRLGPVGTFLAQAGGGMLTGAGLARQGLTLLGRLPASASLPMKMLAGGGEGSLYGAVTGALHTDTGKTEDYLKNAAIGGLLGAGTGAVLPVATAGVQKAITPYPTADPVRAKAMQTLAEAGVDVTAGTKTGAPKLRLAEDVVGKLPFGGTTTIEQMPQVTRAVMEKAGIVGPRVATPDVVGEGFKTVGGKINSLQKPYAVPVDDTLLNAAAKVESDVKPLVEQGQQGPLQHFIDKITSGQELSPDMAQAIRTQLNEAIKAATGQHQRGLIDLKNALDDALKRTMLRAGDNASVEELDLARNQYAHLHILSDALNRSGAEGMKGVLTPSALAAALKSSVGKVGFTKGEGNLNDLARASAGYLQPPRDSGTATREGFTFNPNKLATGVAGRLLLNNPPAQAYWGNQVAPRASGAQMQPAVPGLISAGTPDELGPADRIRESLLTPGGLFR